MKELGVGGQDPSRLLVGVSTHVRTSKFSLLFPRWSRAEQRQNGGGISKTLKNGFLEIAKARREVGIHARRITDSYRDGSNTSQHEDSLGAGTDDYREPSRLR